jgi:hypothetical protein
MGQPIEIRTRVFLSDEGWSWRVEIWVGNLDTRNAPPTKTRESHEAVALEGTAILAALRTAQKLALALRNVK